MHLEEPGWAVLLIRRSSITPRLNGLEAAPAEALRLLHVVAILFVSHVVLAFVFADYSFVEQLCTVTTPG